MKRQIWRWPSALAIAGALALGLAWSVAPAHAAGGCGTTQSCIHWSSDMIYAGHNNGYPEGPVGEHAAVTGQKRSEDHPQDPPEMHRQYDPRQ